MKKKSLQNGMTTVGLKQGRVCTIFGCEEKERLNPQELLFDVEYTVNRAKDDTLDESIDYREVFSIISSLLLQKKYLFLEFAVEDITISLLNHFQKMHSVTLTIYKSTPFDGVASSFATKTIVKRLL